MKTLIIELTAYSYLLLATLFAIIYLMMKYSVSEKDDYIDIKEIDENVEVNEVKESFFYKNSTIFKIYTYLNSTEGKTYGINRKKCSEMFNYDYLSKVIYKLKEKGFEFEKKKINNITTYFLK